MATLEAIMSAFTAQVQTDVGAVITNLQVNDDWNPNPSPPAVDVFPGDPFIERIAMGGQYAYYFTVRVRVSTADHEGGQSLLLQMMDPHASTSVTDAIEGSYTVNGTAYDITVEEGPSPFGTFNDPGSIENRLLGALWRVRVL